MSLRQFVGVALVALPFVAIFVGATYELGVLPALGVFAAVGVTLAVIWAGIGLIFFGGDDS